MKLAASCVVILCIEKGICVTFGVIAVNYYVVCWLSRGNCYCVYLLLAICGTGSGLLFLVLQLCVRGFACRSCLFVRLVDVVTSKAVATLYSGYSTSEVSAASTL